MKQRDLEMKWSRRIAVINEYKKLSQAHFPENFSSTGVEYGLAAMAMAGFGEEFMTIGKEGSRSADVWRTLVEWPTALESPADRMDRLVTGGYGLFYLFSFDRELCVELSIDQAKKVLEAWGEVKKMDVLMAKGVGPDAARLQRVVERLAALPEGDSIEEVLQVLGDAQLTWAEFRTLDEKPGLWGYTVLVPGRGEMEWHWRIRKVRNLHLEKLKGVLRLKDDHS